MTRRILATETQRHREKPLGKKGAEDKVQKAGGKRSFTFRQAAFLILSLALCLCVSVADAATHVTATYDLGSNPQIMTTVGGQPQYGLVFAQRSKAVTYNSVEYTPSVVKGYLNAGGVLNDGAGNLWLDLIPNLGAAPADSYYVVTFNIQGRVHAEIWVLPDVASVAAETVRQSQPPSSSNNSLDLALATGLLTLAHGGTNQSSWTADRCVRVNSAGTALESAANDCGTGGGGSSHDILSATHTDTTAAAASRGALITGQGVSPTRWTIMPKGAQFCVIQAGALDLVCEPVDISQAGAVTGTLSAFNGGTASSYVAFTGPSSTAKTFTLPNFNATLEYQANKDSASGYAGLTAGTRLNAAQGLEVWSSGDLTDFSGKSGSGTTILGATISSPGSTHYLGWNGSNWVNRAIVSGDLPSHNHAAGDVNSGSFGFSRGGTNQTSWTASRCVRVNDAGTALESASGDCGTGGGGGDNVSVNGAVATDADFDDATPAAPANAINAKWQKDASSPNNISAHVPYAAPLTVSAGNLTVTTSPASAATVVGTGRTLTGGTGIASLGDLSADRTVSLKYSDTLAGNPGLTAEECVFTTDGTASGGFLCEGTTANSNEQLYLFPSSDGADTTNYIAFADSSGNALAGDSATSFFSTGTLEDTRLSTNVALYNNGSKTWGAGSGFNWTFDAGAIDPVFEFTSGNLKFNGSTTYTWEGGASDPVMTPGNGVWNLTTGTLQEDGVSVSLPSRTETVTNKTLDVEAAGNNVTDVSIVVLEAASCIGATAANAWDDAGNGDTAPTAACNDTGAIQRPTADFSGSEVNTFERTIPLPPGWTGAIDVTIRYVTVAASPSGNVEWDISTVCRAVGESWDGSFNAIQTITDTVGSQNFLNDATQSAITTTGCAAGEDLTLRVSRDGTNDSNNDLAKMLSARLTVRWIK